jgi:hypothetical protein
MTKGIGNKNARTKKMMKTKITLLLMLRKDIGSKNARTRKMMRRKITLLLMLQKMENTLSTQDL